MLVIMPFSGQIIPSRRSSFSQDTSTDLFTEEQMKDIIFAYLFPLFLKSSEFSAWMANRPVEDRSGSKPPSSAKDREEKGKDKDTPSTRIKNAVVKAVVSLGESEIEHLLEKVRS